MGPLTIGLECFGRMNPNLKCYDLGDDSLFVSYRVFVG
ncbi:unnamed protein product [Acanthoscelides obtectus]|uniref:Uncharacterized protein n=1 Tax=Acanthoscelides obtectus TaxID=200917 RepID=A0A9P0QHR4_ACAOB|nr:unnamed protein product [Acanthoscelides obtectus]CAH2020515.1 unnamed protein product [Acanthoscelides obtectus]CAK1633420.1 hypothetical protein AOBTE_LOCUS8120 [Acanthoscelides obtectus]CAK1682794.1 hypothetical protein AOBTE_LOCUS33888 [Acanthoscelides obtectus]